MATEVALGAFSSIVGAAKFLFKQIQQESSYVFKYQSYIDGLKNQVDDLGDKRERVEQPVNRAKQQGDEISKDVADWLTSADDFTENVVKPINGDEEEAQKRCFKGLCPNLFKRYRLSKKAHKAAKEGADLLGKGNFPIVSYRPGARDLERKVKELEFLIQRVEKDVEHAERQGEQIFEDVKDWLVRVKDFSDKAVNASEEVDNLLREGNFTKFSYRSAPDRTKLTHVKNYQQFDSRVEVFQQVMEALKDNKFNIIGVYGMAGVGKTTLVKQVRKQVLEDKLFDEVVMAEVTQTPDHMAIQNKIAYDLGMKFDQNESVLNKISHRLREKRVLIILDNIWKKLEFGDVGIPFENDEKERRCTIILTSRRQDLLSNQMNSQKNFSIEVLSENEAWQLFEKIVGDLAKQSDFQPTAVKIVERCGGLPVALSTVANALKNKRLAIWKDVLKQLRSSNRREIPEMDANVYSSIELSYNFLESDEAKSLFLLCGLFSEGHPIKVRYLIRCGMGLGLFENVYTLEAGRNRVHTLIDSLKTSCLLLNGDVEDEVKMHDIIHVVAVSIAAEKHMFNITNAAKLKKEIEKIKQLECPQLKFLMFTKGESSRPISPDPFFEGMNELKVLYVDDICCVPSLPSSLSCLINLQTLCLESCKLEDIATVGQLKNLEILSFRDSNIKQLPLEIGQLTGLRLLDLSNCWSLKVIAPNVLSRLSRLEELYVNLFTEWEKAEGGKNARLVELNGLSKLTTLEICIPDVESIPQALVSVELERHNIQIGGIGVGLEKYKSSRSMGLNGLEKNILLGNHKMKILIKRTECLSLMNLKGLHNVVQELDDKEGFPLLKHFYIRHCSEILHIVSSVGWVHCEMFPLLESLRLCNLINLEKVCLGQVVDNQSFSNLRIIEVDECVRLKHLFSFSMTKNLLHLRKVNVRDCDNLETIVGPDIEKPKTTLGIKEIIAEDDPDEKVIFPNLEKLEFGKLPKLTSFVVEVKSVEFSTSTSEENTRPLFHEKVGLHRLASDSFRKLKKLGIYKCDGLTSIFSPMVIFPSLEELKVDDCQRLKHLFSYSTVNNLPRLLRLEIFCCESMEAVVVGRDAGKLIEMVFPKLHYVEFQHLRNLTSFAVGINSVAFPSLLQLQIKWCDNLRKFISTSSSKHNTRRLFDEKVNFLSLEELEVIGCDRLKHLFSYSTVNNLPRLQRLKILHCKSMEVVVVGRDGKLIEMAFPKLHYLELSCLRDLTSFAVGINSVTFPSLLELEIQGCNNLRKFISTSSSEDNIQHLFDEKVALSNLMTLSVFSCDGLRSLMTLSIAETMVNLKEIKITYCKKIEEIIQEQAEEKKVVLPNLTTLLVENCDGLRSLMTLSIAESLVNLTTMKIEYCEKLEKIIQEQVEKEKMKEDFMVFSQLQDLELVHLPSLTCFCLGKLYTLEFPSLKRVYMKKCPNMKTFSQGELRTPKLHKVTMPKPKLHKGTMPKRNFHQHLYEYDQEEYRWEGNLNSTIHLYEYDQEYRWEGNLNSTIQKMFKEMSLQV